MLRSVALASLVLLCAGVVRAEGDEAPLVLGSGEVLVERWTRPAPSGDVHYGLSGWYDLLIASGTRLDVVDRATGETRASFDVGCEVRGLASELVLCDDGVRWIGDLRDGTFVPLRGLPAGVLDAEVCGDRALIRTEDGVALLQLPSKLDLAHVTGRVAPFRLPLSFRPAWASFDPRCRTVIVEGDAEERAFLRDPLGRGPHRRTALPRAAPGAHPRRRPRLLPGRSRGRARRGCLPLPAALGRWWDAAAGA